MNDVPLREFIERIITENNTRRDDLRIEDSRRLEDYKRQIAKALKLQADEYERRLLLLNHEAARIQAAIDVTVSRDTWDGFQKNFQEWKSKLDLEHASVLERLKNTELLVSAISARLKALEDTNFERGGRSKSFVTIFAALSVVATLVTIANVLYGIMK